MNIEYILVVLCLAALLIIIPLTSACYVAGKDQPPSDRAVKMCTATGLYAEKP